jgi:hypothetical protein
MRDVCAGVQGRKPGSLKVRLWKGVSRLWDGFRCIRASHYLSSLTVYIILTTTISSMMYFMKSMVRHIAPYHPFSEECSLAFLEQICRWDQEVC